MYITVQMGFQVPDDTDWNGFFASITQAAAGVADIDYARAMAPRRLEPGDQLTFGDFMRNKHPLLLAKEPSDQVS